MRIDAHNPGIVRIGDRRHNPLSVLSQVVKPYHARPEKNRNLEYKAAPVSRKMRAQMMAESLKRMRFTHRPKQ